MRTVSCSECGRTVVVAASASTFSASKFAKKPVDRPCVAASVAIACDCRATAFAVDLITGSLAALLGLLWLLNLVALLGVCLAAAGSSGGC